MSVNKILLAQVDLHHLLFNNVLVNISNEESEIKISDQLNTVKWLAGHLLWAQDRLADLGGLKIEAPWLHYFCTGITPANSECGKPTDIPTLQMIIDTWNEYAPLIRTALKAIPDDALNTMSDIHLPISQFDNTLGGRWAFVNHHQAYTIGQIGILRKGLGKEGMKYA